LERFYSLWQYNFGSRRWQRPEQKQLPKPQCIADNNHEKNVFSVEPESVLLRRIKLQSGFPEFSYFRG
jgi:hypothetical protein